jgi:hypothetical protein
LPWGAAAAGSAGRAARRAASASGCPARTPRARAHGLVERALVEALHEKAALVAEHLGFEDQHTSGMAGGGRHLHQYMVSRTAPSAGTARSRSWQRLGQRLQLRGVDPAAAPGDSSGQATFRPWRCSSVAMNWPASSRLSWVPVSSQA